MSANPCKRLGLIWPDTGEDLTHFEMAQAASLNRTLGGDGLAFEVECSKAPPGHGVDALFTVGEVAGLVRAAVSLAQRGAQAVVWACTSGSFIGGWQWGLEQCAELRARTGVPVTSATLALVADCRQLGYCSVDVLSPYPEAVSEIFLACLRQAGLRVAGSRALDSDGATASAALRLADQCRAFARGGRLSGDAVIIPDTAVNSLSLIPELEAALGKPVVTANQACLQQGAVLLGAAGALAGKEAFRRYQGRRDD